MQDSLCVRLVGKNRRVANFFCLLRDYRSQLLAVFADMVVAGSMIVTVWLAAWVFGPIGFGEYSVILRGTNLVAYPLLMNLSVGLPRYISRSLPDNDGANHSSIVYLYAAVTIGTVIMVGLASILYLLPQDAFPLLLGSVGDSSIFPVAYSLILGLYSQAILYGYMRGRLRNLHASSIQFVGLAAIPAIAILLSHDDVDRALLLRGYMVSAFMLMALSSVILMDRPRSDFLVSSLRHPIQQLVMFGLPRVPGDVALFGIYSVPVILVTQKYGPEQAGFLSLGMTLMQLSVILLGSIGAVAFPYFNRLLNRKGTQRAWQISKLYLFIGMAIHIVIVLVVLFSMQWIVPLAFGDEFVGGLPTISWILIGSIPFAIYVILRTSLDSVTVFPFNTINLLLTLVAIVLMIWHSASLTPSQSVAIGLGMLGTLSIFAWYYSFRNLRQQQESNGSYDA